MPVPDVFRTRFQVRRPPCLASLAAACAWLRLHCDHSCPAAGCPPVFIERLRTYDAFTLCVDGAFGPRHSPVLPGSQGESLVRPPCMGHNPMLPACAPAKLIAAAMSGVP